MFLAWIIDHKITSNVDQVIIPTSLQLKKCLSFPLHTSITELGHIVFKKSDPIHQLIDSMHP
jgi:hypothetical protein